MFYFYKNIVLLFIGLNNWQQLTVSADSINLVYPPAKWFVQKTDHFSPANTETWKQRYYVNDSFYDAHSKGPIFLRFGGEGEADPSWIVTGAWIEYAKKFKALCFYIEHRFFGASRPAKDLTIKSLEYLTSQQALADTANFITGMNKQYKLDVNTTKWVTFGGSYSGNLAAWMRYKYPHLVFASVASSANVRSKVDFKEYLQVVEHSLEEKTGSLDCANEVKAAHKQLEALMKSSRSVVEKDFEVCEPFTNADEYDVANFYITISFYFSDLVQYNEDNRLFASDEIRNFTINAVCDIFSKNKGKPYQALVQFVQKRLKIHGTKCLDYNYKESIKSLRNTSIESDVGRQYLYQSCTEFGLFQTPEATKELFGNYNTLAFNVKQCQDVFGNKFNEKFIRSAVDWTNNYYGSTDIKATRVVYVHGSIDPWHALGITKTIIAESPAILIKGSAHCADTYQRSNKDSKELKQARIEIENYLDKWLNKK